MEYYKKFIEEEHQKLIKKNLKVKKMRWNKKYDYPTSSRATVDGIRRYLLGEKNYLVLLQFLTQQNQGG